MTLRMRPRVSGPTGIVIGSPVSVAWVPRTNPSVVSIAIVRTTFSPTCCATSRTSFSPDRSTCSALRIAGNSPSKWTSTTGPTTWVIVPMLFLAMFSKILVAFRPAISASGGAQRFGAGNDLDQFLGNRRLASAVVVERQPGDHIAGIAGRVVHRGHARALFARGIFEEGGIDLHCQILRQQIAE